MTQSLKAKISVKISYLAPWNILDCPVEHYFYIFTANLTLLPKHSSFLEKREEY